MSIKKDAYKNFGGWKKFVRGLLIFTLGGIGALIINKSKKLKPENLKIKTGFIVWLFIIPGIITFIYAIIMWSVTTKYEFSNEKTWDFGMYKEIDIEIPQINIQDEMQANKKEVEKNLDSERKVCFSIGELNYMEILVRTISNQYIGYEFFVGLVYDYFGLIKKFYYYGVLASTIIDFINFLRKEAPIKNDVFSMLMNKTGWTDADIENVYGRKRVNSVQELCEFLESKILDFLW